MASSSDQHAEQQDFLEDTVCYFLYPDFEETSTNVCQLETRLKEYQDLYMATLAPMMHDYIWQNQPFFLHIDLGSKKDTPPALLGKTNFGDNVEDEWFIVFLLKEITKAYPGTVARVYDGDGQFLLIEAADNLPKWLKPETSTNRIFIAYGELHILPMVQSPAHIGKLVAGIPTLQEAINCVRKHPELTRVPASIQRDIDRRIHGYPGKYRECFHHANCYLPAVAAAILQKEPSLVTHAARAFSLRDPIDLKACRAMKHFSPESRVLKRVKFTRVIYAQLLHQRFRPPEFQKWDIPLTSYPQYKSHDLGMKLAYGFEILCSQCKLVNSDSKENYVVDSKRWKRYQERLKETGYFNEEVEGSAHHQELLTSAKKYFSENIFSEMSKSPGQSILHYLKTLDYDREELKRQGTSLPPSDDDSWLEITAEDIDLLLYQHSTRAPPADKEFDPSSVMDSMKSFVNKISSYEGAEFADDTEISFNPDDFTRTVENILQGFSGKQNEGESSSDSENFDSDNESDDNIDENMTDIMRQMDQELVSTTMAQSFEKAKISNAEGNKDSDDSSEGEEELDIDVNLLKNILESYSSQEGLAGPATNILHCMGVHLPENADHK